jgi:hypothetical protein
LGLPIDSKVDRFKIEELLADTIMCRDLFPVARERAGRLRETDSGAKTSGPGTARSQLVPALGLSWTQQHDTGVIAEIRQLAGAPTGVFFHVDAGVGHPFLADKETKSAPDVNYRETLRVSATWFTATQPGGKPVLLTDDATPVDGLSELKAIVRLPVRSDQMMYSRMRAYHALLASGRVPGPVLLLDTDVCLTRDFAPLFDGGFDIGLTYRQPPDFAHMPVNEGVILVADGAAAVSARFFEICLSWYDWLANQPAVKARYDFDIRYWRGGQLSLAAFVDWTVPPYAPRDVVIDGIRVRFFPCDLYNYAVRKTDKFNLLDTKWALHFKGAGPKKLMADYQRHRAKLFKA